MKKIGWLFPTAALVFLACGGHSRYVQDDCKRATALSDRAQQRWMDDFSMFSYDSVPDISSVLEMVDSAIALAPQDVRFYRQKAGYLEAAMKNEELAPVLHRILSFKPDDLDAIGSLGMCLDRLGKADSARYYYRKALAIARGSAAGGRERAYLDSVYTARLEYFIDGDREAALRKIRESTDTARMSPDDKQLYKHLLEDFDMENARRFPYGRATGKEK